MQDQFFAMSLIYKELIYSLLTLIIGTISTIILTNISRKVLKGITSRTKSKTDDFIAETILKTIKPVGIAISFYFSTLNLPQQNYHRGLIEGCFKLIITFFIIKSINLIILRLIGRWTSKLDDQGLSSMVRSLTPLLKSTVWSLGFIFYLQNMGVRMAAIWALLSAGGIGAGLALKEPVQEFFEYIIILLDKPFQDGEFINIENVWATIERVGVRSTRLRSLNGECIVVSNSFLTNGIISNYAQMKKRRLVHKIGVTYDTDLIKMKKIPKLIESIINSVDDATFDRCHFTEFANSSLEFEIVYYIPTNNYSKAMEAQQNINLKIMEEFQNESIEFAFPTQTINISGANNMDTSIN